MLKYTYLLVIIFILSCQKEVTIIEKTSKPTSKLSKVTKVLSGDSIELEDGRIISYLGAKAPKDGEYFFKNSKEANSHLIARGGYKVLLKFPRPAVEDENGNPRAYVYAPYKFVYCFVNQELLEHGFVHFDPEDLQEQNKRGFFKAQEKARTAKLGLWNRSN